MNIKPTDAELLDRAVICLGVLHGTLEEVRVILLADDSVKWGQILRGIERSLALADQLRADF